MVSPLPPDLPAPSDDGATDHLPGAPMPAVRLISTDSTAVRLDDLGPGRTVIYLYPPSGRADLDLPEGWDAIPGARGRTNEACDLRDHHTVLLDAGASAAYGLSTQSTDCQVELLRQQCGPLEARADLLRSRRLASGGLAGRASTVC